MKSYRRSGSIRLDFAPSTRPMVRRRVEFPIRGPEARLPPKDAYIPQLSPKELSTCFPKSLFVEPFTRLVPP